MRSLSLFAGIGGIDLALEQLGVHSVAFCDWEKFPQEVLQSHWPEAKVYGDVCDLSREVLERDMVVTDSQGIHILTGGFPCQPHSIAGKRKAKEDERHLWPEMARLIGELRPKYVFGENVRGLLNSGHGEVMGDVLADMVAAGYRVGWGCYGAADVGAVHQRDRVFVVGIDPSQELPPPEKDFIVDQVVGWLAFDAWPAPPGYFQHHYEPPRAIVAAVKGDRRKDRLKALGNAVVPAQAFAMALAMLCGGDESYLDFSTVDQDWLLTCSGSRNFDNKLCVLRNCFALVRLIMEPAAKKVFAHLGSGKWRIGGRPFVGTSARMPQVEAWPTWGYTNGSLAFEFVQSSRPPTRLVAQFPPHRGDGAGGAMPWSEGPADLWRTPTAQEAGARVETLEDKEGNPAMPGRRAYRVSPDGSKRTLQSVTINQQVEMCERAELALWATPQAETTAGELPEFLVNSKGGEPRPGDKLYRRESGRTVQTALTTQVKLWPGEYNPDYAPLGASAGSMWPTPRTAGEECASSYLERQSKKKHPSTSLPLSGAVQLAECYEEYAYEPPTAAGNWPTPAACIPQDGEDPDQWLERRKVLKETKRNGNGAGMPLTIAVQLGGPKLEKPAKLNPDWVELLMGFPPDWTKSPRRAEG